jgi:hypothetical protein
MRVLLFTLLLTLVFLGAEDQDAFVEEPNLVGKITAALIEIGVSFHEHVRTVIEKTFGNRGRRSILLQGNGPQGTP